MDADAVEDDIIRLPVKPLRRGASTDDGRGAVEVIPSIGSRPPKAGPVAASVAGTDYSVLDAVAITRDRMLASFEDQARTGSMPNAPDRDLLSAADRLAVEEAWAKAGIPTLATPRGLIELTKGLLEAEEWRRVLGEKARLQIAALTMDLDIIEAGRESAKRLKKLTGEQTEALQKLSGRQTLELQKVTGKHAAAVEETQRKLQKVTSKHAAIVEQNKLEESRLQQELRRLGAEVKKKEDATARRLAELEADLKRKAGEIRGELTRAKLDADHQLSEYQQKVDNELARIKAIRTDSDLKRAEFRARAYAKKEWIYGALALLAIVIALVATLVAIAR